MVARPGLLEPAEVLLELLARGERGAVDAGEHLPPLVAAPVGARHRRELERLDASGRGTVGAAAQVGERAVAVERHRVHALVAHEVLDQLDLVVLTLLEKALDRLAGRHVRALERLVSLDVATHRLLDPLEVGVRDLDPLGELEVVVEAVLDRWADRHLGARVELEHGGGENVGGVVADEPQEVVAERTIGAPRDDLDRRTVLERRREVGQPPVRADRERRPRQARADGGRRVGSGGAVGQLELGAVGQLHSHDPKLSARRATGPARPFRRIDP